MQIRDLTGQKFGKLTVLGLSNEKSGEKILWKCQCECGKICLKTRDVLLAPTKRPKACSIRCSTALDIGLQFNKLTIIERIEEKGKETQYKCKCACGKEIITTKNGLLSGHYQSCGCYKKERMSIIGKNNSNPKDITGQKFGKLTALEPTEKRQGRSIIWKCQCECGAIHYASVSNLQNGDVNRCNNCKVLSIGEEKIKALLSENNISYETQKTFESCRFSTTNALAKFDFWVNNQYIIEYDGIQHFKSIGWNSDDKLAQTQYRDNFKNQWCKENNIPLIRIPYTHLEYLNIKDLILETSDYLIS